MRERVPVAIKAIDCDGWWPGSKLVGHDLDGPIIWELYGTEKSALERAQQIMALPSGSVIPKPNSPDRKEIDE